MLVQCDSAAATVQSGLFVASVAPVLRQRDPSLIPQILQGLVGSVCIDKHVAIHHASLQQPATSRHLMSEATAAPGQALAACTSSRLVVLELFDSRPSTQHNPQCSRTQSQKKRHTTDKLEWAVLQQQHQQPLPSPCKTGCQGPAHLPQPRPSHTLPGWLQCAPHSSTLAAHCSPAPVPNGSTPAHAV